MLQEVVDIDIEIDRQFRQIEDIYREIKADMARRQNWITALKRLQ